MWIRLRRRGTLESILERAAEDLDRKKDIRGRFMCINCALIPCHQHHLWRDLAHAPSVPLSGYSCILVLPSPTSGPRCMTHTPHHTNHLHRSLPSPTPEKVYISSKKRRRTTTSNQYPKADQLDDPATRVRKLWSWRFMLISSAHSVSPEGNRGWKSSIAPVLNGVWCVRGREEGKREGKVEEKVEV